MRPIDADALIEDFKELNEWLDIDEEAEIVSLINNAPTVSAEAVSEDTQTKTELVHIKGRLENVEKKIQGLANDVLIDRSRTR